MAECSAMHMDIYAIVEAPDQEAALSCGKDVFRQLCGTGTHGRYPFDYFTTVAESDTDTMPVAARIDSEAGEELLDMAWDHTIEMFEANLENAREALEEYDADAIRNDEDLSRFHFTRVGAFRGPTVPLYDQHANGISRDADLEEATTSTEGPDFDVWIVPADVHY